jgi:hypothetical protein
VICEEVVVNIDSLECLDEFDVFGGVFVTIDVCVLDDGVILLVLMLFFVREEWPRHCLVDNSYEILDGKETRKVLISNRA